MAKGTVTKDFQRIDNPVTPNNENIEKVFMKESKTLWGVGKDGVQYPLTGEGTRIVYGVIILAQETKKTSIRRADFLDINERKVPHILYNNNLKVDYERCFFKITQHEPSGDGPVWDRLMFYSTNEMYAFLIDNASHDGDFFDYPITMDVYDIVDSSVPMISKVSGTNMFYAMLKGRKKYKQTTQVLEDKSNWGRYDDFIQEVVRSVAGYNSYVRFTGDEGNRLVWMPGNHRKLYGMPPANGYVYLRSGGARCTTDGTQIIDNGSSPNGKEYGLIDNASSYYGVDMDGNSFQKYNKHELSTLMQAITDNKDNPKSFILCYKVYDDTNIDGNSAVYVKPVGIDVVELNYFDRAKYDLYSYTHGRNRYNQLKKIDSGLMSSPEQDTLRMTKEERTPDMSYYYSSVKGYYEQLNVRFILKDKVTRKISPISKARIVRRSGRDRPIAADVRQ